MLEDTYPEIIVFKLERDISAGFFDRGLLIHYAGMVKRTSGLAVFVYFLRLYGELSS